MSYYVSKMLPVSFDEAVRRTTEVLKSEGFGVLTEIDVKQTLKAKIDVDFRNYLGIGNRAIRGAGARRPTHALQSARRWFACVHHPADLINRWAAKFRTTSTAASVSFRPTN